ncbi:hypothetical protein [Nonomuraea salmonea]|uniref:hypothetical protein n=1 Tax=Nonomuraea salmonea TaxID=46181 RepID=UPI002FE753A4
MRSPRRPPTTRPGNPYTGADLYERDPYYRAQAGSGTLAEPGGVRTGLYGLAYEHQYPTDTYLYDDEIDIEDAYSALVRYRNGASLAYTLDFSSPWEGFRVVISGTHGQIESRHGRTPDGTPLPGAGTFTFSSLFGTPEPESLRLGLPADALQGALAVATGEAIWRSAVERRPIDIAELLS